ncbi:hypothetical protein D6C85_03695 [Aureobasidium pullulans]|uniref:F-box domain-containing protein n=1 Tax=Aureobasidium pullulans TaxID=5580 RepID=A0A4V4KYN0_AURPU|nr:hypothetical protein D6C85_03695 [Aureobasidium pullulans]
MAHLPNEVVRVIANTYRALSEDCFTDKCFEDFVTSIDRAALDHLLSVVCHAQFGPAIKTLTIQMSGIHEEYCVIRSDIMVIFEVLRARKQQVAIKVVFTAMNLPGPGSKWHELNSADILLVMFGNVQDHHDLNVSPRTLDFSLPSPAARSDISPARTKLASTIAHISLFNETRITYTDAPGSILYDPQTQTLKIEKLKVEHLHEVLPSFSKQTPIRKICITATDIDESTLYDLLWFEQDLLVELELKDISLFPAIPKSRFFSRHHLDAHRNVSWYRIIDMMRCCIFLDRLDVSELRADGDVEVAAISAVTTPNVFAAIHNELRRLEALRG